MGPDAARGAEAAAPSFVRCLGGGSGDALCGDNIFFADAKAATRHHVTSCSLCRLNPCSLAKTVSRAAVAALRAGPDFTCSMVPGGGGGGGGPKWVFDMGDNMAGFAELKLPRAALQPNVSLVLKYAEVLRADGSANMAWCSGEGEACDCSGINCANQTDTFIPGPPAHAQDTWVSYTPSFTYHGFRYVQVRRAHKHTHTCKSAERT